MSQRLRGFLFVLALCGLVLAGCSAPSTPKGEGSTEGRLPKGTLSFEGGPVLSIEIAATAETRHIGLSYRDSLCETCGLYFVFPEEVQQTFWMRRMRLPIDILWIQNGKVAGVAASLPPPAPETPEAELPRYESPVPVRHVLEVPAGFAKAHGIAAGTPVRVQMQ